MPFACAIWLLHQLQPEKDGQSNTLPVPQYLRQPLQHVLILYNLTVLENTYHLTFILALQKFQKSPGV